jgi:3-dehydroquinate synthase
MQKVFVEAQNGSYEIILDTGIMQNIGEYLNRFKRSFLISDSNVYQIYGKYFDGIPSFVIKAGEESKSHASLLGIYDELARNQISREDAVIALGGGVVGDLAGFAAATFKRGVHFIQVPTTLLAQVDSSVGGKVGINLKSGKNMVGSFYQPSVVLMDMDSLRTLDKRQFAAGMAEIIKYAFIADRKLYEMLLSDNRDLTDIIRICCSIKAAYVHEDPFDKGVRMQLNFGHTIGHAIETVAGYGTFLHGEAIAIGMVLAARIGERVGISAAGLEKAARDMLIKYGLPVEIENELLDGALSILLQDKKAAGNRIHFILIDNIGHAVIHDFTCPELRELLYD